MKHKHKHDGGQGNEPFHHELIPYWKRAHRDWRFILGVILMFAAMIVYVMSNDLAWRPRIHPQPSPSRAIGK